MADKTKKPNLEIIDNKIRERDGIPANIKAANMAETADHFGRRTTTQNSSISSIATNQATQKI